jgi:hypothetical protein
MVEDRAPVKASGAGKTMPFAGGGRMVRPCPAAHRSRQKNANSE